MHTDDLQLRSDSRLVHPPNYDLHQSLEQPLRCTLGCKEGVGDGDLSLLGASSYTMARRRVSPYRFYKDCRYQCLPLNRSSVNLRLHFAPHASADSTVNSASLILLQPRRMATLRLQLILESGDH